MNYYITNKKYLAEALSFIGFNYYKFNGLETTYTFVKTNDFVKALNDLYKIKNKYNNH